MFQTSYLIILREYLLIVIHLDYKNVDIFLRIRYHSITITDNVELLASPSFIKMTTYM